ncbi:MAG TPA: DUF2795 domain-containing protein [Nitrososphaeraceae archaeon]
MKEGARKKINEVSGKGSGRRRTKFVLHVNYATTLALLLKDLKFPANKEKIIAFLLEARSLPRTRITEALSLVQQIEEKMYKNVAEVVYAIDLVRDISE